MTETRDSTPMSEQPALTIPAGTRFGYREGPLWHRRQRCLVETPQHVVTGPGLHLLVAPNGSGKTTLLRTLAGLLPALSGSVNAGGHVYYFSDELRADSELKPRTLFRSLLKNGALAMAEELAETLRLDLNRPIGQLSRGNRQKVLLILAEVKVAHENAGVLLMDEPLTGLDAETRAQMTALWSSAQTKAVRLVILHELESVRHADSLLSIHGGRLAHAREKSGATWLDTYHSLQS